MSHVLRVASVYKDFYQAKKPLPILKDVTLDFRQDFSYAITGSSGSGKSTFLHILGGLDTPTSGSVFFDNQNIYALDQKKKEYFLHHTIGFVFQFHYLIKELTVLENVMMKALISGDVLSQAKEKALLLLDKVGLYKRSDHYPTQLSGGEQQRTSIARALINKPAFLLADEPTGNLDATNARTIINLFLSLQEESGTGIIICTHDKSVYETMDTVLQLENGVLRKTS